jgi:AcrR family transcriptional regulator
MSPVTSKHARPPADGSRPDGRAVRWEGQHERRRREFVDAAMRAIAEHGPEVSTAQIAAEAGVARTRIYKHFEDAADLQRAIGERALEMVTGDLEPLWKPQGSAREMITAITDTIIGYLSEHRHLYHYLTKYAPSARDSDRDVVTDVKAAIAGQVAGIFTYFLTGFGASTRLAEIDAFAMVGMVESVVGRWIDKPAGITRDELAGRLTSLIWHVIDQMLRDAGIALDPDAPLELPGPGPETGTGTGTGL